MARTWLLKIIHHLLSAFQNLIIHSLIMQKTRHSNAYVQFDWVQQNYSKTTGSLSNFYRDEPNSGVGGESNVNYSMKDSKSFDYKQKLQGVETATIQKKKLKLLYHQNIWAVFGKHLIHH